MTENVYYRYNIYKKNGIDLHLVINEIFEPKLSANLAQYNQNQYLHDNPDITPAADTSIQVSTKSGLAELAQVTDGMTAYVVKEDNWYIYTEGLKIWTPIHARNFTYAASFYLQYSNDNDETAMRCYFYPRIPSWKTIEAAKDELKNLDIEYVDFVADNGYTFFLVDNGHSSLFDVERVAEHIPISMHSVACLPYGATLASTDFVPCKKSAIAYAISFVQPSHVGDLTTPSDMNPLSSYFDYTIEGVVPNRGNSSLLFLMNEWNSIGTDKRKYLPLAEAVKSDGYAKIGK